MRNTSRAVIVSLLGIVLVGCSQFGSTDFIEASPLVSTAYVDPAKLVCENNTPPPTNYSQSDKVSESHVTTDEYIHPEHGLVKRVNDFSRSRATTVVQTVTWTQIGRYRYDAYVKKNTVSEDITTTEVTEYAMPSNRQVSHTLDTVKSPWSGSNEEKIICGLNLMRW